MYKGRIAAVAAAFLLVASMVFVGCGPADATGGKVVLKVLAYGDNSMKEGETWKQIVADFQAANPNIEIQDEMLYDEAYHQKAKARLAAKDYPHVAYQGADERWAAEWRDAGQQYDHRSILDGDYYDLSLIPPMGDNGEIWEIPLGTSNICTVLYVNTELLAKYGMSEVTTYEDMVKLVEPAKKDGIEVIAMAGKDAWVWNSCLLSAVIGRLSGDAEWMRKAVKGEHKFTDPAFVDSLAMIEKMLKDGVLPASTLNTDYGAAMAKFANGKSVFFVQGQWAAGSLFDSKTDSDALTKQAKIKMMAYPAFPGESASMADSVAAAVQVGYGLTKFGAEDPAAKEAALKFLKFVSNEQNAIQRLRDGAIVAPILKNYSVPEDLEPIIKEKVSFASGVKIVTNVVDAFLKPVPNDALNAGIQDMAIGAVTGESGHATPESIAAKVEELARQ